MTKYFFDCEFYEFKKPVKFLGFTLKEIQTIDPISIGIVGEDGREYYAVCNEFDVDAAWYSYQYNELILQKTGFQIKEYWIRENVLRSVYDDLLKKVNMYHKTYHHETIPKEFNLKGLKYLLKMYGRSRMQIANEICEFIYGMDDDNLDGKSPLELARKYEINDASKNPVFYAYYASYDWTILCQLFDGMMSLPKGFPMYVIDHQTDDARTRIGYRMEKKKLS